MMNEMVKIFAQKYEREKQRTIIQKYTLNPGVYYLVNLDDETKNKKVIVNKNDKFIINNDNELLLNYDYNSQLISMNKPMDKNKQLHSNNYLSVFIKLENEKIKTQEQFNKYVNDFYDSFYKLDKKYSDKKSQELFNRVKDEYGEIEEDKLEKCRNWLLENGFAIYGDDKKELKKGYFKIFFEFKNVDNDKLYEKENNRYLIPNIFNDNKYCKFIDDKVYGLSGYNMNMNQKKPYLNHFHRKNMPSNLVDIDFVLMQKKLFDYLMIGASLKKNYAYFDIKNKEIDWLNWLELPNISNFEGYLLQFKKGKEIELIEFSSILVNNDEIKPFRIKNYLELDFANLNSDGFIEYVEAPAGITSRQELGRLIDNIFFNSCLNKHKFKSDLEVDENGTFKEQIMAFRKPFNDWFYNDNAAGLLKVLNQFVVDRILYNLSHLAWTRNDNDEFAKANVLKEQKMLILYLNLKDYLKEGVIKVDKNEEIRKEFKELVYGKKDTIDSDRLFYYAMGQLYRYLLGYSQAREVKFDQIIPLTNTNNFLKKKLIIENVFKKYSSAINISAFNTEKDFQSDQNSYFSRVYAKVMSYTPAAFDKELNSNIIVGFLEDNFRYFKKEGEE